MVHVANHINPRPHRVVILVCLKMDLNWRQWVVDFFYWIVSLVSFAVIISCC